MAELRATPYANPLTGLSNDVIQGLLGYMKDRKRTQQMQGLAGLLESTGIPKTVERAAYAESPTGLLNALTNVNRANVPLLKPETADALLTLSPVPSGANKAAMVAGKAGERYAEKVVPQILERGGLPASLLEGMAQGSISPMDVWHGSPHGPFKKFDATKIGTGEGAQAYGYGHYLGEARGTGERYRKALTGNQNSDQFVTTIDGNPTDSFVAKAIIREGGKPEPFIAKMQSKLENQLQKLKKASKEDELGLGFTDYDMELMDIDKTRKIINEAEGYIGREVKAEPAGYLYKVDLPDEAIAKMLDYDKPIKDQPEVLKAIRNQIQDADIEKSFDANVKSGITGANAMKNYVWGKTPAEQSEALRQAGVTGIRYLDAGSRNIESGTSNFIVFPKNEDLLTIKEINDRPITSLLE